MTILDLLLNSLPISTLMTTPMITTTTSSADEHGNIAPTGETTLTSYITTVLGSIEVPEEIVVVYDSMAYVESMSDEQLNKLENMLLEKEFSFEKVQKQSTEELPKVYIKTNN